MTQNKAAITVERLGAWRESASATTCVCDALMNDSGCAVTVVDLTGQIRACNEVFAALLDDPEGSDDPEAADAFMPDLNAYLNDAAAIAHAQARQAVAEEGQPVVIDGPFAGRRSISTYREYNTSAGDHLLLVVARWAPNTPLPENARTISLVPSTNDKLSSLTPRELEVLRHIAQGMSTIEIARSLHRSTKTIEGHRVSLGVKLNARNRVELAQIAWLWGLAPVGKQNDPAPSR